MRCVWVKAYDRAGHLPLLPTAWREGLNHLRPPVDNRLEGSSSWKNLATGRDRQVAPRLERRRARMSSRLRALCQERSAADRHRRAADDRRRRPRRGAPPRRAARELRRCGQRDRQHRRARARVERRDRDRADATGRRARAAGRVPRQEPPGAAGGHPRRVAARRRQHRLPDGRRRDRRRRARGAPRVRLRRAPARLDRGGSARRARHSRDGRSIPHPTSSSAPSRTPARHRSPTGPSGRRQEGRRRRALPAAADLLPAGPARGLRRAAPARSA